MATSPTFDSGGDSAVVNQSDKRNLISNDDELDDSPAAAAFPDPESGSANTQEPGSRSGHRFRASRSWFPSGRVCGNNITRSASQVSATDFCVGAAAARGSVGGEGGGPEAVNPNFMGTLTGVFSPVALSMFSSLLFLGVGYIVGNAGAIYSLVLLLVAYFILGMTILSVCAIATNGAVQGGGVYFMISRTLGPELGGSIGVLFWAANTVGSALFATGCIEAVMNSFGPQGVIYQDLIPGDNRLIELGLDWALLLLVTVVGIVGPGIFGKFILVFLMIVVICTLTVMWSFFGFVTVRSYVHTYNETTVANCTVNCTYEVSRGAFAGLLKGHHQIANFTPVMFDDLDATFERDCHNRDNPVSVFTVFGVLFSGVTGILAGANLSGELKNPSASIPRGTIAGTVFTFLTYLALFLLTAATCERNLLYHECLYMYYMDMWGPFVAIGTICATLCASLSCLLGASRVLHAVGKDNMFGTGFQAINKELRGNPVFSVLFTALFVGLLFLYGSLNAIAQLCSVLYLLSYAAINASCFFLDAFSSPNFRPTFKYFHSSASLIGFILTLVTMFAINYNLAAYALFSCLVITLLLGYLSPAAKDIDWGSMMQNLLLHQVRKYLLKLDRRKDHVKFWRPHIILLVKNPRYECAAIHFVNGMKKGGLYVLGHVKVEDFETSLDDPADNEPWLKLIDHMKIKAFAETTVSPSVRQGVQQLVRISGIGALKPNTVVMGFHEPVLSGFGKRRKRDYFVDVSSGFASLLMDELFAEEDNDNARLAQDSPPAAFARQQSNASGGGDPSDSQLEFVQCINDVLKIGKNVCIYRNFEDLTHPNPRPEVTTWAWYKSVFAQMARAAFTTKQSRRSKQKFIDVWFVDFFAEPTHIMRDRRNLFMLQMAYIVSISSAWKSKLKLRVLYRVFDSDAETKELLRKNLKSVLKEERIKAVMAEVSFDEAYQLAREAERAPGSADDQLVSSRARRRKSFSHYDENAAHLDLMKIPMEYVQLSNQIVQNCSSPDTTAVTFIHLPAPPPKNQPRAQARYLQLLAELTKDLPPTVLVHGIHAVTTTAV